MTKYIPMPVVDWIGTIHTEPSALAVNRKAYKLKQQEQKQ